MPTGCAIFPKELYRAAARLGGEGVQRRSSGRRCRAGGHFAALEEPKRLVDDVRSFFRKIRG